MRLVKDDVGGARSETKEDLLEEAGVVVLGYVPSPRVACVKYMGWQGIG